MKRFQQIDSALNSNAVLTVILDDATDPDTIFSALWSQINFFEQKFSRFLPRSELTKFNHQAGKSVKLDSEFIQLLKLVKSMSEQSGGIFNPFVLPALCRAGYCGSWAGPDGPDEGIDYAGLQQFTGYNQLAISGNLAKIPRNTAIDLGGIGKGYLLDQLSADLEKKGIDNYWLSIGGDIICNGLDADQSPWQIEISNALSPEETVGAVSNDGKKLALATSGITKRQGFFQNKHWHHLIDPASGQPAKTDLLTATVCADTATLADVTAKCFVIAGSEKSNKIRELLAPQKVYLQLRSISSDRPTIRIIKF